MKLLQIKSWTWKRWSCLILLIILAMPAVMISVDRYVEWRANGRVHTAVEQVNEAPVGLVLGTSKYAYGHRINLYYSGRIKAAAELYHSGKVRGLIVSGDNGRHGYNEPAHMKEDLIAAGVPAEVITEDFAGFRTLDSIARAKAVFGQDKLIIVSQDFHVRRALFLADQHDIEAEGYATAEVRVRRKIKWKMAARELLARNKALLDCWVLGTEPKFYGPQEEVGLRAVSLER